MKKSFWCKIGLHKWKFVKQWLGKAHWRYYDQYKCLRCGLEKDVGEFPEESSCPHCGK